MIGSAWSLYCVPLAEPTDHSLVPNERFFWISPSIALISAVVVVPVGLAGIAVLSRLVESIVG